MTEIKLNLDVPAAWVASLRSLHDHTGASSSPLSQLADQIEEQIKPTIDEPTEWGSVVLAQDTAGSERMRWIRLGHRWWRAERNDYIQSWDRLKDVEVLRVGVGPQPLAEWESDLLNFQHRRDTAAAVLMAMDVDQCLIDAVINAKPDAR